MKLAEVEHLMQCGDGLFFRGTAWTAYFVEWLHGDYSHFAWFLRPMYFNCIELPEAAEALWGVGSKRRPLDRYLSECWQRGVSVEWYKLDDSKVDREKLVRAVLRHLDLPYANWWQLSLSYGLLGRWARRFFRIRLDEGRLNQVCSELGACGLFAGFKSLGVAASAVRPTGRTVVGRPSDWHGITPAQMSEIDCWKEKVELTI